MKDSFSHNSKAYLTFRPTYPNEFYELINSLVPVRENCWDCGTGNGQVAFELAKSFDRVYATDISQNQVANAIESPKISYSVQPAEHTIFPENIFDLVVVAQAIHWFNFEKFYSEVRRTCKEGALLVVIGYGLIKVEERVDSLIGELYDNTLKDCWDKERKHIEEKYQSIPFPFEELECPSLKMVYSWTKDQLIGYLSTWSAVKHFKAKNLSDPIVEFERRLMEVWPDESPKKIEFPQILRIGKL